MKTVLSGFFSTLLITLLHTDMASAHTQSEMFFEQTAAVSLEELDNERGRGAVDLVTLNNQYVTAFLQGDANNNHTGSNSIDSSSFSGASGLISVIQNTGNNVIIQDSTIVNVTIAP